MSSATRRQSRRTRLSATGLTLALLTGSVATLGLAPPATADDTVGATADDTSATIDTDYGRLLLVLDSSGSMAEPIGSTTKIAAAKASLGTVIDELPEEASVGLRVFGASVFDRSDPGACTDTDLVVEPGTGNRGELRRAVRGYEPYGETPISQALQAAAADLGGEGKRSIVLVSDGEATCAPDPCEVAGAIVAGGIDLQIDVVGLDVSGAAREQLRCVAASGGGTYYDAADTDQLTSSLTRVSQRAARPFSFTGTPIEGSNDPISPTELSTGEWVDTIGADRDIEGNRYYRIERTVPGSTIHLSAGTLGAGEQWEALSITLSTEDGTRCASNRSSKGPVGTQVVGARITVPEGTEGYPNEDCRDADALLATVERSDDQATGDATMALKVFEESPVSTTAGLPLAPESPAYIAPDVAGEPTAALGGSSFADATALSSGRYVGDIVPGETQMFRVPLDWGQSVRTRVLLPETSPALEQAIGSQVAPYVSLEIFDPMHAELGYRHTDDASFAHAASYRPSSLRMMTDPVRYLDRDEIDQRAVLPGDHYLSLAAAEDENGRTYSLPYVLEVEVVGEPAGEPDYTVAALAPDAPGSGLRSDLPARVGTSEEETDVTTEAPEDPTWSDELGTTEDDPSEVEPTTTTEPMIAAGAETSGRVENVREDGILDDAITPTSVATGSAGLALLLAVGLAVLVARPRRRP